MSKFSGAHLQIDVKLMLLLVDVASRSHQKKNHRITAGDEEYGGLLYDIQQTIIHYTTDYKDRDVIHNNFDQLVISHPWMVLHVQSCVHVVTATHLVKNQWKAKTATAITKQ